MTKKCKATTRNGKKCRNDAVFGDYCCPHYKMSLDENDGYVPETIKQATEAIKLKKQLYYYESMVKSLRDKINKLRMDRKDEKYENY